VTKTEKVKKRFYIYVHQCLIDCQSLTVVLAAF